MSLVAIPLTPKYVTLYDLEWPFYVRFLVLRTALSEIILHTYRRAEYWGSAKGLRIFRRRKVAGATLSGA